MDGTVYGWYMVTWCPLVCVQWVMAEAVGHRPCNWSTNINDCNKRMGDTVAEIGKIVVGKRIEETDNASWWSSKLVKMRRAYRMWNHMQGERKLVRDDEMSCESE